jgi:hypothetical protein
MYIESQTHPWLYVHAYLHAQAFLHSPEGDRNNRWKLKRNVWIHLLKDGLQNKYEKNGHSTPFVVDMPNFF